MEKKIKSIKLLYPSLMREGADREILDMLKKQQELSLQKYECFKRQQELENELDEINKHIKNISGLFSVEYEEATFTQTVAGDAPMVVESNGTVHI